MPGVKRRPDDPAFRHGKAYGYECGCRCEPCLTARRAVAAAWSRRQARTAWGHVEERPDDRLPLWPAQDRVEALLQRFSYDQTAVLTGVIKEDLLRIRKGRKRFVTRKVRDRILAVPADVARPPGDWWLPGAIPREWVEQMIGSLAYLGWSGQWVAVRVYSPNTTAKGVVIRSYQDHVTRSLYLRVKRVYDSVGDSKGPSRSASIRARKAGWGPPGAYDAEHRLIPGAIRTSDEIEAAAERHETERVRREKVMALTEEGLGANEVGARMGIDPAQVRRDRAAVYKARSRERETLEPEAGRLTG